MERRYFLKKTGLGLTGLALTASTISNGKEYGNPKKPNIIYILADDLGYGDLGCYGQKKIKTPNLDRMAKEGMRFMQHYSGSTVCAPSRATLMLGLHTGHLRTSGQGQKLRANDKTVAELLHDAGYATGLIGKWGIGPKGTAGEPLKKGFDYFCGYINQIHAHNYYPEWVWQNNKKIGLGNKVIRCKRGYARGIGGVSTNKKYYSDDLFLAETMNFINRNKKRPFFLYFAMTLPHANNEYKIAAEHGMEIPNNGIYKDKKWPDAQKAHAAMISRLDSDVGDIMEFIRSQGLDKNTIIIFSSDNGPHKEGGAKVEFFNSNGKLRGLKRDLYEGGIRVPMIARWPEKIKAGTTSLHISAFYDMLPTFCDIANIKSPENIDGISFLPTLLGKTQSKHKYLYWKFMSGGNTKEALRIGKYKVVKPNIRRFPTKIELYDLDKDLGEKSDISKAKPQIIAKARKLFTNCCKPITK